MPVDKYDSERVPTIQTVDATSIPEDLRAMKTWVCWKWVWKENKKKPEKSKWTKPPCDEYGNIGDHQGIDMTFSRAMKAHLSSAGNLGIGVSIRKEDNICGIDLDGVVKKNGKIKKKVSQALEKVGLSGADVYTEVSPSGAGLRIFGIGKPKTHGSRPGSCIEVYSSGRYLTVTGKANGSAGAGLIKIKKQANQLVKILGAGAVVGPGTVSERSWEEGPESNRNYQKILRMLPALGGIGYEEWMQVGMAMHHETEGADWAMNAWIGWAEGFDSFDSAEDCNKRWIGFGKNEGKPVTIGSVIARYNAVKLNDGELSKWYDDVDDAMLEFNSRFTCAIANGVVVIIEMVKDEIIGGVNPVFMSLVNFKNFYGNVKCAGIGKDGAAGLFANYWLVSADRASARKVVFDPKLGFSGFDSNSGVFNLWCGFSVEPDSSGGVEFGVGWDKMMHHIFQNICSANEEWYDYLIMWLARIVQDPGGERPGVCVSLYGKKGVGKGILAGWFGKIFGSHYAHCVCKDDLVGRFNSILATSVFSFADEAYFPGDKQSEGRLNALITEPMLTMEEKFMPKLRLKNCLSVMMASNEDWSFPATADERRYFALEVSDKKMQDGDYFRALVIQMEDGGLACMLRDLLLVEVDMAVLRNPPVTKELMKQVSYNISIEEEFWIFARESEMLNKDELYTKADVWKEYRKYCKDKNVSGYNIKGVTAFGHANRKVFGNRYNSFYRKSNGRRWLKIGYAMKSIAKLWGGNV